MTNTRSMDYTLTDAQGEYDVEVEYVPGYYTPAQMGGHPDTWAPSEGEPSEIHAVNAIDEKGGEINILSTLSAEQVTEIEIAADENEQYRDEWDDCPY